MSTPILIGLHITKTGGTSLAMHAKKKLGPREVYLCSSFREASDEVVEDLVERLAPNNAAFVFGHYVHESLIKIYDGRDAFWFTGVRDPQERAVSEYYQICKIRAIASQPPISADEFLRDRSNSMCHEFARAFPTIAANTSGSLAERAIACVEMFDYVYDVGGLSAAAEHILGRLGVGTSDMAVENARQARASDTDYLNEEERKLRLQCAQNFSEDQKLYDYLKPFIGKPHPFRAPQEAQRSVRQLRWTKEILMQSAGWDDFIDHLAKYKISEFMDLDREKEVLDMLARKARYVSQMSGIMRKHLRGRVAAPA